MLKVALSALYATRFFINQGEIMEYMKKVAELLQDEKNRDMIVDAINRNVNIPVLGEKTEAKIYDALLDTIAQVLDNKLSD
tara:strand:- start:43 stop:285 length:243 start_codon:yes stop_codon:yes gene_type:complete